MPTRRKKNDTIAIGFIAGISLPLFIFLVIYLVRYPDVPLFKYMAELWHFDVLLKIISLCVFPNLLIFLLYYRRKMDFAARGVLAATIVYALMVLASKIF
jgi:hypothetical protein